MRMQAELFEISKPTNGFRDSAFAKNKELPLHRWVPWIAGFSAEFVDDCLDKYLRVEGGNASWILDPFAGVGTTLLQAFTRGHNVLGFEINPYAAMAARAKLQAVEVSRSSFEKHITSFQRFMDKNGEDESQTNPQSKPPTGFFGRTRLFSPKVERKVLFALDFINSIEEPAIRDLFRLASISTVPEMANEPSQTARRCCLGPL